MVTKKASWLKEAYQTNKLEFLLQAAWTLTVISVFLGDALLSVRVPAIGELFPFRVFLPVTCVLYLISVIKKERHLWKGTAPVEKACMLFIVILLIHSVVSLPFAIDVHWSFRRTFNLCFDLSFFFLMLCLCRDRHVLSRTLKICLGGFWVLSLLGVCESVWKPLFYTGTQIQYVTLFGFKICSPMVIYNNTNDYMSAITFLFAGLLLGWLLKKEKGKRDWGHLLAAGAVSLYLAKCASARLLIVAFWLLLAAIMVYALLLCGKRAVPVLLIIAVLLATTTMSHVNLPVLLHLTDAPAGGGSQAGDAPSLKDQFFESDAVTGELTFNNTASAGVRVRLILHSVRCFLDSKGMGVGVGDTEQLARIEKVAKDGNTWSIHCFLARLLGDYGLWAALPLVYIVLDRIWYGVLLLKQGWKNRVRADVSYALLYLVMGVVYVIASTSSSDAQDLLAMWMFLAVFVLMSRQKKPGVSDPAADGETK